MLCQLLSTLVKLARNRKTTHEVDCATSFMTSLSFANRFSYCVSEDTVCDTMAAIPYAVHNVKKIRECLKHQKNKQTTFSENEPKELDWNDQSLNNVLQFTSPNYSDKMMNSIWGLYNRLASHSFQKNIEEIVSNLDLTTVSQRRFH
ncbi:uncharacterized protein LOC143246725 [Tachypleus tridentatus]|uniref:uncharacterized protein LOC143246725 n=1 Tax=Tachypleus tridentatus TaxID=6853 RepID=UPI003FD3C7EF